MKHSAHVHELDNRARIHSAIGRPGPYPYPITETMSAIYLTQTPQYTPQKRLDTFYGQVDIILIEGWISGPNDKIEVRRKTVGRPPLFSSIQQVKALVSDYPLSQEDALGSAVQKI